MKLPTLTMCQKLAAKRFALYQAQPSLIPDSFPDSFPASQLSSLAMKVESLGMRPAIISGGGLDWE